ncbi:hypothetical protein NE237_020178 [Protea cynaroides]|uniref:Uncharacterized protein n=1 Tax=Protea cynaroides TaxID=273540 RepID=A0A9Q0H654_9MAGN|nr:hypothetical protein NE237_020178 [Protea cynaroides]
MVSAVSGLPLKVGDGSLPSLSPDGPRIDLERCLWFRVDEDPMVEEAIMHAIHQEEGFHAGSGTVSGGEWNGASVGGAVNGGSREFTNGMQRESRRSFEDVTRGSSLSNVDALLEPQIGSCPMMNDPVVEKPVKTMGSEVVVESDSGEALTREQGFPHGVINDGD